MNNDHTINSPFRYAGGKFYARKLILKHIPYHSCYIEPFAGGASIFFAKGKVRYNHLNDLDHELINVYYAIRDFPELLIEKLKRKSNHESRIPVELVKGVSIGDPLPASKELHNYMKNNYEPINDMDRAFRWYYLNRTSYSGIMNKKNMYWGYGDKYSMQPKNWANNIRRSCEKLHNAELTSIDFEQVIDNSPDNAFLFIDPPYFNADQDKFYTFSFLPDDHYRLAKCLRRNSDRVKMFLTYENSPEIRELYNWMERIYDKEWNYCIQRTDDQKNGTERKGSRYKGKELFILNYDDSWVQSLELKIVN